MKTFHNRRTTERRPLHGWLGLLVASLTVIAIWMLLLPRIGSQPSLRSSIDRREALGINAEAMFYTDLEAMETLVVQWNPDE